MVYGGSNSDLGALQLALRDYVVSGISSPVLEKALSVLPPGEKVEIMKKLRTMAPEESSQMIADAWKWAAEDCAKAGNQKDAILGSVLGTVWEQEASDHYIRKIGSLTFAKDTREPKPVRTEILLQQAKSDTEQISREETLEKLLKAEGFRIDVSAGDGDCQYTSVMKHLIALQQQGLREFKTEVTVQTVKRAVGKQIFQNLDRYANGLLVDVDEDIQKKPEMQDFYATLQRYLSQQDEAQQQEAEKERLNSIINDDSDETTEEQREEARAMLLSYQDIITITLEDLQTELRNSNLLDEMLAPGRWGGNTSLAAMANAFNVQFKIWHLAYNYKSNDETTHSLLTQEVGPDGIPQNTDDIIPVLHLQYNFIHYNRLISQAEFDRIEEEAKKKAEAEAKEKEKAEAAHQAAKLAAAKKRQEKKDADEAEAKRQAEEQEQRLQQEKKERQPQLEKDTAALFRERAARKEAADRAAKEEEEKQKQLQQEADQLKAAQERSAETPSAASSLPAGFQIYHPTETESERGQRKREELEKLMATDPQWIDVARKIFKVVMASEPGTVRTSDLGSFTIYNPEGKEREVTEEEKELLIEYAESEAQVICGQLRAAKIAAQNAQAAEDPTETKFLKRTPPRSQINLKTDMDAGIASGPTANADAAASAASGVQIDRSKPVTSIQIRFGDGRKKAQEFNEDALVDDLFEFIKTCCGTDKFDVKTGFPPADLSGQKSKTLKDAGLLRGMVTVKAS